MTNWLRTLRFLLLAGSLAVGVAGCGGSGSSSPAAVATAKSAEWTSLEVRVMGDGAINVNWERPTGLATTAVPSYNLYCSTDPADIVSPDHLIAEGYQGHSFDHTSVVEGQRYYYVVTQVTSSGEGPASRPVSASPQPVRPAAPYGLKVTALAASAVVEFTGPTPSGAAAVTYNLYRSTVRGSFAADKRIASQVTSAALTRYADTSLANGTAYYYTVTAVSQGRESNFSPVVSARPQPAVPAVASTLTQLASFASPAEVSAEPGNASCLVKWTDVAQLQNSGSDPAGSSTPAYILYWSDTPDVLDNVKGSATDIARDPATGGFGVTGLGNGVMYYLQLVAAVKGADGNPIPGRYTAAPVVSVTPAPKVPAAPSGVGAAQGSQQVSLSWNRDASGVPGVTYNVYFTTTDPSTPAEVVATGARRDSTKNFYNHTGLQAGRTYYYVVTAVAAGEGESAPSSIVSVSL